MISTDRLYDYVKRNAPHWYQAINHYGGVSFTNGSMVFVTGCDKTKNYANVGFPYGYTRNPKKLDIRYTQKADGSKPWSSIDQAETRYYRPSKEIPDLVESAQTQCIFIRGLRFSLSEFSWWDAMRDVKIRVNGLPTYLLGSRTRLQLWLDEMMLKMNFREEEGDIITGLLWDLRVCFPVSKHVHA